MNSFGLIIDELGVPGLHKSVEAAKASLEREILVTWRDLYDTLGWSFGWSTGVDAEYEHVTVYDGPDEDLAPISDDYQVFQVWDVWLND